MRQIGLPTALSGGTRRWGGIVFLAALAVPVVLLWTGGPHVLKGFPLDDAWIHMVYGRSIAAGGFPAYNAGIPSTGSTSPLWAYVLGVIHLLFSTKTALVVLCVKAVGAACHGLSAWAFYRILKRWGASDPAGILGGLILGFSPVLAAASISGMEVSLGSALCLWGMERFFEKRFLPAGILFGLAGLARPEYATVILVFGGVLLSSALRKTLPRKNLLEFVAPIALAGGLFLGWDLAVTGRLFPATFYVKTRPVPDFPLFDRLFFALRILTREAPLAGWIVWGALAGWLVMDRPGKRRFALILASASLFTIVQVSLIPPADPWAFYYIRYLLPAVPLFWLSLAGGAWAGWAHFRGGETDSRNISWSRALRIGSAGAILLVILIFSVRGTIRWRSKIENDGRNIDEVQVALGRDIDRILPLQAVVGTVDAGAVRYFGKRRTVDLVGLNTPEVLRGEAIRLDAAVLMPAWTGIPDAPGLEILVRRGTKNYQITSVPRMNHQLIMICRGRRAVCSVPLELMGRRLDISLNAVPDDQVERMKSRLR